MVALPDTHRAESWRQEFFPSRWLELSINSAGHRLHYIDEGQGEAVLCVHGNPTWSFYYRKVIERLRGNFRVIAYDHFGCGLSARPEGFAYDLASHIEVCSQLVEALGLRRVHLVVHDWGGPIGLGWAGRMPGKVASITVLNSAVFMEDDLPRRIALLQTPLVGDFLIRRCNLFARAAVSMATAKGLSATQKAGLLYPYGSVASREGIARFVQDIPSKPTHPSFHTLKDVAARAALLPMPVQLLWGMKDFCFHPGFIAGWQRLFPQARLQAFAEAGHYLLEDEPLAVPQAIAEFCQSIVRP